MRSDSYKENNLDISNISIFLVNVDGSLALESTKSEIKTFFFIFVEFGLWMCVILKLSEEGFKKKSHLNLLCLISECKVKIFVYKMCVWVCASVNGMVSL